MGSPSASFVLGFTPCRSRRRAKGEGGVTRTPAADELNQLQRLIDYGVITGHDHRRPTSCRWRSRRARASRATSTS